MQNGNPQTPSRSHATSERERRLIAAELRRSADELVARRRVIWDALDPRQPSARAGVDSPPRGQSGLAAAGDSTSGRAERAAVLRRMIARILSGDTVGRFALDELVADLVDRLSRDRAGLVREALDLGATGGTTATSTEHHSLAVATMSVLAAAELGWSRVDVYNAGLTALVADFGMALLPAGLTELPRPLTELERNAVMRHPAYSVAMLGRISRLPPEVELAAYQHHERENGSGYPGRLRSGRIHDLARVIAVADVFVGAAGARAFRPRTTPHAALLEVARMARAGALDRDAAAALVRACGAYPPGSVVRLNTGDVGTVLETRSAEHADRPVVRIGAARGWTVDLSAHNERDLAVAGVVNISAGALGQ